MRFWVFIGAAGLAVLAGINPVVGVVEWWGGSRSDPGPPPGVVVPSPWTQGVLGFASIVGLFALGAVFIYLAIRAKRQRVTTH